MGRSLRPRNGTRSVRAGGFGADMKRLVHDIRAETKGRPALRLLVVIYAAIPVILALVATLSLIQRSNLANEARRNCQRAAAIANFIRDSINQNPNASGPAVKNLVMLERTLRSIGSCPD